MTKRFVFYFQKIISYMYIDGTISKCFVWVGAKSCLMCIMLPDFKVNQIRSLIMLRGKRVFLTFCEGIVPSQYHEKINYLIGY